MALEPLYERKLGRKAQVIPAGAEYPKVTVPVKLVSERLIWLRVEPPAMTGMAETEGLSVKSGVLDGCAKQLSAKRAKRNAPPRDYEDLMSKSFGS